MKASTLDPHWPQWMINRVIGRRGTHAQLELTPAAERAENARRLRIATSQARLAATFRVSFWPLTKRGTFEELKRELEAAGWGVEHVLSQRWAIITPERWAAHITADSPRALCEGCGRGSFREKNDSGG